ncbi:MAG TPA: hypothetical protein VFS10_16095 [Pyrinomonadaceae bacterium]|nr:hypothetical protein [Pyrinomonadaceae bacterium]
MADREVEETLREIRERVRAAASQSSPHATLAHTGTAAEALAVETHSGEANGRGAGTALDALSRMEANLSTTERAWNRLPPVLSNRGGWVARLELWVKRKIKRALHWVTWEQVNFNSSVHHALRDARAALAAHEQLLSRVQSESASHGASLRQLKAEAEAETTRVDARLLELGSRLASSEARLEARLTQTHRQLTASVEQLSTNIIQLRDEVRAHAESLSGARDALVESARGEQSARLAEFEREVRGRLDALLEEQRVCFRQLSLEAGETAVSHDRARRQLEARLEEIQKAVSRDR